MSGVNVEKGKQGFQRRAAGPDQRASAPSPNVAMSALQDRVARLNQYRLVLAVDSTLPVGIVRCVECGQFVSEMDPSHDCPLPKMLEAGIPAGRARDLARAGFADPAEVAVWGRAIDELGVTEAAAFKTLGYSPIDARRAAEAGQSGWEMLAQLAESEQAPVEEAKPAKKARASKKDKSAVTRGEMVGPDAIHGMWTAGRDVGVVDGATVTMPAADIRELNKMIQVNVSRGAYAQNLVFTGAADGTLIVSDQLGQQSVVVPDGAQGGPWMIVASKKDVASMMAASGSTLSFTMNDGQAVSAEGIAVRPLDPADATAKTPEVWKEDAPAEVVTLPDALAADIASVRKVASKDVARPTLTRVEMQRGRNGGLVAVATDSYRMRVRAEASEIPADGNWSGGGGEFEHVAAVPAAGVAGAVTAITKTDIGRGGAATWVDGAGRTRSCTVGAGEFPRWRQLLGTPGENRLTLPNTPGLRKAMKAACPDASPIRVHRDAAGRVRLQSQVQDRGVSIVHSDPGFDESTSELAIAFNPDYLADVLDDHDGQVELVYHDTLKPGRFLHPRGVDLLMPVRTG